MLLDIDGNNARVGKLFKEDTKIRIDGKVVVFMLGAVPRGGKIVPIDRSTNIYSFETPKNENRNS